MNTHSLHCSRVQEHSEWKHLLHFIFDSKQSNWRVISVKIDHAYLVSRQFVLQKQCWHENLLQALVFYWAPVCFARPFFIFWGGIHLVVHIWDPGWVLNILLLSDLQFHLRIWTSIARIQSANWPFLNSEMCQCIPLGEPLSLTVCLWSLASVCLSLVSAELWLDEPEPCEGLSFLETSETYCTTRHHKFIFGCALWLWGLKAMKEFQKLWLGSWLL